MSPSRSAATSAEAVPVGPVDAGRPGGVREGAIAVVAKEHVPHRPELLGRTIAADLPVGIAAEPVVARPLPVAVAGDVEVQIAVVVEIQKRCARRPGIGRAECRLGR